MSEKEKRKREDLTEFKSLGIPPNPRNVDRLQKLKYQLGNSDASPEVL